MILFILFIPFFFAVVSFFIQNDFLRRMILVLVAVLHIILSVMMWLYRPLPCWKGWLVVDDLGLLFLLIISVLFLAVAVYSIGYLSKEAKIEEHRDETGHFFSNSREAVFTGCLMLFLTAMTLVTFSQHFGMIWVAIEATTLASAPLIYFHQHHRSLEAAWKYLLICSVGIAMALLGNFLLAVSASEQSINSMLLPVLIQNAEKLDGNWLIAASLLLFVGYGTKMGLAPMHTWLPDAHSEAPSVISALLSGALLNCALLGILRLHQICLAAGMQAVTQDLFILFGLFSVALATVFMIKQNDYKRMLAYSSVEHMGIIAFGIGLGGIGVFGSLFHAINHSLLKASLFLLAGNILSVYQTKTTKNVTGLVRVMPATAIFWLLGFFAISGLPPFGTFMSKFIIIKAALDEGHFVFGAVFLIFVVLVFASMLVLVMNMSFGQKPNHLESVNKQRYAFFIFPSAVLCLLVLLFGFFLPQSLFELLSRAAVLLGGVAP